LFAGAPWKEILHNADLSETLLIPDQNTNRYDPEASGKEREMTASSKNLIRVAVVFVSLWQTIGLGQITASLPYCSPSTLDSGTTNQVVLAFTATNNTNETLENVGGDIVLSKNTTIDNSDWELWSGTFLKDTLEPYESFRYGWPAYGGTWPIEIPYITEGSYYIVFKVYPGGDMCYTPVEIIERLPEVTTLPAMNVGPTYATLNGKIVDDGGESCQYLFLYRDLNSSIWQDTGWQGSVSTGENFSATVSDLKPGVAYEFRADAKNSVGMAYTDDTDFLEFATPEGLKASEPSPADGAQYAGTWVNLTWKPGDSAVLHHVYLGTNFFDIAPVSAQTETSFLVGLPGFTYPNGLIPGTRYYWRIDEVLYDNTVVEGDIWSFIAEEYVSVPIITEEQTLEYDNTVYPYFTEWIYDVQADLTAGGLATDLTLTFKGDPENSAETIYVTLEDSTGANHTVTYPDPNATRIADWVVWRISLTEFARVDTKNIKKLIVTTGTIGEPGGKGTTYISYTKTDSGVRGARLDVWVWHETFPHPPIPDANVNILQLNVLAPETPQDINLTTNPAGNCFTLEPFLEDIYYITVKMKDFKTSYYTITINNDPCRVDILLEPDVDDLDYPVKLIAEDGDNDDWLGRRVSISDKYAIAGANRDNDDRGSAYIFENSATGWIQKTKLTALSPLAGDRFGGDVSISGEYAIVGAERNDYNGPSSGAAYIFHRTNTGWIQQDILVPKDGSFGDQFGCAVSIYGNYAIIGAHFHDDGKGSAYIFKQDNTGWKEEAKLTASDGTESDWFGDAVSICGEYAIVGAPLNNNYGTNSGSAYIFERDGSTWNQKKKLVAGDGQAGDEFGGSVCLSGNYAVIGAISNDDKGEDSGAAYIFERSGENWIQKPKLVPFDGGSGDHFGNAVSIDGDYAVVAAVLDADNGTESGSAYIFKRNGQNWEQQIKLTAPDGEPRDYFGQGISISDNYIIVGVPYDDDNGYNAGCAYVFKN